MYPRFIPQQPTVYPAAGGVGQTLGPTGGAVVAVTALALTALAFAYLGYMYRPESQERERRR